MPVLCHAFFFTLHSLEQVLSHPLHIWLILVATYGCDTGAYFGGRFLGRHKMNERVSPKKTWGGLSAAGSAVLCCRW
ncbi:MAG: phosphatidate cytidylyltransferase [Merdibacter sp.]